MTKIKTPWRRRLLMPLCVILLFSAIFPVAAYAESGTVIIIPDEEEDDSSGGAAIIVPDNGEPTDITISSSTVPSYFETNAFTGTWRDTGTPLHLINETGYIAYCLQTAMDSPNNSGYTKIYWWDMYSSKVANGIFAIVTNGYPNNTGGFSTDEARYATANALRFWLGECGAEGAYDWMNLKTNPNNFRGKSGYEDLFDWCVDLVEIARAETDGMPSIGQAPDWHDGSASFLWQTLEASVPTKYYLSSGQCSYFLLLAQRAGCPPPKEVETLLIKQGGEYPSPDPFNASECEVPQKNIDGMLSETALDYQMTLFPLF